MPSKNATTTVSLNYFAENPKHKVEKPCYFRFPVGDQPTQTDLTQTPHSVEVTDIRSRLSDFTIDESGFELTWHETKMSYEDFGDHAIITTKYFREIEEFLKQKLGASRVFIFDKTVRMLSLGFHRFADPRGSRCATRFETLTVPETA